MALNRIEEIIEDIRLGRMVILMDDEDRENEGDLIMAAPLVRAEDINFMARYGRGLICLPLTRERCRRLELPLMVSDNNAKHSTNFTVSIEAARNVTTGISAHDRAQTVQAAVAPDAGPADIVQPGHIFPLMAQPGGVLTRAGHTEAGCDLARFAGLEPAAVIVEILNEDGSMARRADLEIFAERHALKIGTVEDLIRYRIENEKTVQRMDECFLPTEYGVFRMFSYRDSIEGNLHLALVCGEIDPERPALVRVHMQDTLCDLLGAQLTACGWPLRKALERIAGEGNGVVLVLRKGESADELLQHIRKLRISGDSSARHSQEMPENLRHYGIGAQILVDIGVHHMRLLSSPKKVHGLAGFGLDIVEYVAGD